MEKSIALISFARKYLEAIIINHIFRSYLLYAILFCSFLVFIVSSPIKAATTTDSYDSNRYAYLEISVSECEELISSGINICALLALEPDNPVGLLDCDGDGWSNYAECTGQPPSNPVHPCSNGYASQEEICAFISDYPDSPLALADCDLGGIINRVECNPFSTGDLNNPADDCLAVLGIETNICAILALDPNNPAGLLDCDGDGWTNLEECQAGPPTDPENPCSNLFAGSSEICAFMLEHPTSPLALADCDQGGLDNITECAAILPGDPSDAQDDCQPIIEGWINVCVLLAANPDNPLADMDCDGDGWSNEQECTNVPPSDPAITCDHSYTSMDSMCIFIMENPDSPLAHADCDLGGITNDIECSAFNASNPSDPSDDCYAVINIGTNICALLSIDPDNPVGLLDCDGDGFSNLEECQAIPVTDPENACSNLYANPADFCSFVVANPTSLLALADCDQGGIPNLSECEVASPGDPADPQDDCQFILSGLINVCELLETDPDNSLAAMDCDGDGFSNLEECASENPSNPAIVCDHAYLSNDEICTFISNNPDSPLANADCDLGGIANHIECNTFSPGDLTDPADDCSSITGGNVNVCALLDIDPSNIAGILDCDGDGFSNLIECQNNTNPNDACSNLFTTAEELCAFLVDHPFSPLALEDCDGNGAINIEECLSDRDPMNPADDDPDCDSDVDIAAVLAVDPDNPLGLLDCDNDGWTNLQEWNAVPQAEPQNPCSNLYTSGEELCAFLLVNPESPLAQADCDGGGVVNILECQDGRDPLNYLDDTPDCQTDVDICILLENDPENSFGSEDCDMDGWSNSKECLGDTDPEDPCSHLYPNSMDFCTFLMLNPDNPLALEDCDNGGVSNIEECQNGSNPLDAIDDTAECDDVNDLCVALLDNPDMPLGLLDCDGDGWTNLQECTAIPPTDPESPCSNLYTDGEQLCAFLVLNPDSPLGQEDCDNGGIPNIVECMDGRNPLKIEDDHPDCNSEIDICTFINNVPTDSLGLLDCDEDGWTNIEECTALPATNPEDPCSNLYVDQEEFCAYLLLNPDSFLAGEDCDNGGEINIVECMDGRNPLDANDDVPGCGGNINICAILANDPANDLGLLDCDGDGWSNLEECQHDPPTDPENSCNNLYTDGEQLCAYLLLNPDVLLAQQDCDNGGITNIIECMDGGDPLDASDDIFDCNSSIDICILLADSPEDSLGILDCDGDGWTNLEECQQEPATDPRDPCDNLYTTGTGLCAFLLLNPDSPLAQEDCDQGGILNIVECMNGNDPLIPIDDCETLDTQPLTCNDFIQISLGENCTAVITPDMILEGTYLCPFDFEIEISNGNGTTISDTIGVAQIGDTLLVTAYQISNGNSCWGMVSVEDKLGPELLCPEPTQYNCTELESVLNNNNGTPTVQDACGEATLTYEDNTVSASECDTTFVVRIWTATDNSGNTTTCEQQLQVIPATTALVLLPEDQVYACNTSIPLDENGSPDPAYSGYPTIAGFAIDQTACNLSATYLDQGNATCGDPIGLEREWFITNWCTGNTISGIQHILLDENVIPAITCVADITITTDAQLCGADLNLEDYMPQTEGDCPVLITATAGTLFENTLLGLPATNCDGTDPHMVTYTISEDCTYAGSCSVAVHVIDNVAPEIFCVPDTTLFLAPLPGTALEIFASAFNYNSSDNCGIVNLRVARLFDPQLIACPYNGAPYADSVVFTECDIDQTVMLSLEATDACGNTNSCMIAVHVQKITAPQIICPPDFTITCEDSYADLEQFGDPVWESILGADTTLLELIDINQCGAGKISRSWTVVDGESDANNKCTQTITVEHISDFTVYFPGDVYSSTCNEPGETGEPVITGDNCELVSVNYEDQLFNFVENACYKIIRTWTVVNWCIYDFNRIDNTDSGIALSGICDDDPELDYTDNRDCHFQDDNDGYFRWTQVIYVSDAGMPELLTPCQDTTVCMDNETCTEGYVDLQMHASDSCTNSESLVYKYTIQLDTDSDDIPDTWMETVESSEVNGSYPLGMHRVQWEVEDGCGNAVSCETMIHVVDCTPPTPVLIGLATALDLSGEIELWASDFNAAASSGSFDNCTASENLEYYIQIVDSTSTETINTLEEVIALGSSTVFNCSNQDTTQVAIFVVDEAGNFNTAISFVYIQDPSAVCPDESDNFELAGGVFTEENDMIAGAHITLSGNNGMASGFTTDMSGQFLFENIPNSNYLITAAKNTDPLNGVTTFDVVLISKHILGIQQLDSPYKMIAADINNSQSITTFDLVLARQMILGINSTFPNNTSWRFIDASYVFPDPTNPFSSGATFPEFITVNSLGQDDELYNFIGIKTGDVNNSAVPNLTDP